METVNKAHVVDGEDSESDSELESGLPAKAFVIDGEAPESDDETVVHTKVKSNQDIPKDIHTSPPISPMRNLHSSLLHQKLWECNISLRATIEGLVKHTTDISVEKLTRADKVLLNVQESMRATNANLTLGRARLKQLRDELEKANCSTALPTVIAK